MPEGYQVGIECVNSDGAATHVRRLPVVEGEDAYETFCSMKWAVSVTSAGTVTMLLAEGHVSADDIGGALRTFRETNGKAFPVKLDGLLDIAKVVSLAN